MASGMTNGIFLLIGVVFFAIAWILKIASHKRHTNITAVYRKKSLYRYFVLVLSVLSFGLFYFFESRLFAFVCAGCALFFYIRTLCLPTARTLQSTQEYEEDTSVSSREKSCSSLHEKKVREEKIV